MPRCVDCGEEFGTPASRSHRCDACKVIQRRKLWNSASKKYQRNNVDKVKTRMKMYRETHVERIKQTWSAYYAANGDRIRANRREQMRRARALKNAAYDPNAWVVAKCLELQTCERLRLTALRLPCGTTECCIGCDKNTTSTATILSRGAWKEAGI